MASDIFDVGVIIEKWSHITYKESLDHYWGNKDNAIKNITYLILEKQGILNSNMVGETMQKLKINENDSKVRFSDIIESSYRSYFSPAVFVYGIVGEYVKRYCNNNIKLASNKVDEITLIVGRGNRSFASFLREVDLAWKIEKMMGVNTVNRCPDQDVSEHTDILLKYNDKIYRIWSYLASDKGLKYTALRFNERRGKVPDGIHLLCPMNMNSTDMVKIHGWYLYSDSFVSRMKTLIETQLFEPYAGFYRELDYFKLIHMVKKS